MDKGRQCYTRRHNDIKAREQSVRKGSSPRMSRLIVGKSKKPREKNRKWQYENGNGNGS
jgi:hypothetical protein